MTKLQLSISSRYVPDWGVREGTRELVQNALDGQQDGYPMAIDHDPRRNLLTISNQGARLDRQVWLMGTTSKSDGDHIGIWGEGLKLGALALVRSGRSLRIVNDDELWSVQLEPSAAFSGAEVVTITTRRLRSATGRFSVSAELSAAEWSDYQSAFLALRPCRDAVDGGTALILRDPDQQGRCYVKGIWVETRSGLAAGYNFTAAGTDRDRRIINSFDFDYYSAKAWANACQDGLLSPEQLLDFLEGGTPDTKGLGERCMPDELIEAIAAAYSARHGALAIPVANYAEANEAGHAGRLGLIANPSLCGFFSNHPRLSLAKVRSQRRSEVSTTFSINQLSAAERHIRQLGLALVEAASIPLGFEGIDHRLEIVEFRSGDILGIHCRDDASGTNDIRIARRALSSIEDFLRVLVHELAHDRGGDGDVRHERAEGQIFSRIVALTLGGSSSTAPPPAAAPAAPALVGAAA